MLNINEEDLKAAIVQKATDEILQQDDDLSGMIAAEVRKRLDNIFADRAKAQIQSAIDQAVKGGFEREYQRINQWGEPVGEKTTIKDQLEKSVQGYWSTTVSPKSGEHSTSHGCITRAQYLMTQICAEDFSEGMKQHITNVTGALKDGLRNELGKHMDHMLSELFRVKSLQDQGKVEKPY